MVQVNYICFLFVFSIREVPWLVLPLPSTQRLRGSVLYMPQSLVGLWKWQPLRWSSIIPAPSIHTFGLLCSLSVGGCRDLLLTVDGGPREWSFLGCMEGMMVGELVFEEAFVWKRSIQAGVSVPYIY